MEKSGGKKIGNRLTETAGEALNYREIKPENKGIKNKKPKKALNAYSLTGIGIGGIVGAGFFLGSSLAISQAGPSVVLAFLLGGLLMSQVLGAMTSISINRPVKGSFRVYTEEFLGKFVGYSLGWIVFISGILSMSSEAIAAGVFLRYWMPGVALPIFSTVVFGLVILINVLGVKYFGYIESGMSFLKILTIILFILVGTIFIFGNGFNMVTSLFKSYGTFFPNKLTGFFQSMLVVVFTYSGISTVAMATSEVKDPRRDIPKATILLTVGIVLLYMLSMLVIVSLVKWNAMNVNISPFVQSFNGMGIGWAATVINGIILIAAISVMAATYFACVQILASLSVAGEAPKLFMRTTPKGFYRNAWILTAIAGLLVVGISFILGSKLFNYLVSSCSYFSFLNWILNLSTYILWLKHRKEEEKFESPLLMGRVGAYCTIIVTLILAVISLRVKDFRMGFYAAAAILLVISGSYFLIKNKREEAR